jgi:hypothetical protein
MGGLSACTGKMKNMFSEKLKGINHSEDLGLDGRIIFGFQRN